MCLISDGRGSKKPPQFDYPADMAADANSQREAARACIESKGFALKINKRIKIEKIGGEKKFGSAWCWREPTFNNQWICGIAYNSNPALLKIGVNPQNKKEWNKDVLKHEHGHYWLMSNYNMMGHDPKFKSCFTEWRDLRMSHTHSFIDGIEVIYDYPSDDSTTSK